jgi:hypothetical protein
MIKFWSISRNAFVQTVRQPIFTIVIVATFGMLVMATPLSGWTMGASGGDYAKTDQKFLENVGLSTLLVSGLLVAAFSAAGVLSREIEDKTALTVLSKPVSKSVFILGKFLGVALAVALAYYLCALVYLMTVRHGVMPTASDKPDMPVIVMGFAAVILAMLVSLAGNYLFGWQFTSAFVASCAVLLTIAMALISFIGEHWTVVPFGEGIRPQLPAGIALMFMAVLVFVATAVAASTRLGMLMTLLVCIAMFVLGSMHAYLFGLLGRDIAAVRVLGWAAPNLAYFYPLDALAADAAIPVRYVLWAGGYCLLYCGALLSLGIALFQVRELDAGEGGSSLPAGVSILAWLGRVIAVCMAIVALVLLTTWNGQDWFWLIGPGILLLPAAWLQWWLWGAFARGAKVTYILVCVGVLAYLMRNIALLAGIESARVLSRGESPLRLVLLTALTAIVALLLVLPKTLRHFFSAR